LVRRLIFYRPGKLGDEFKKDGVPLRNTQGQLSRRPPRTVKGYQSTGPSTPGSVDTSYSTASPRILSPPDIPSRTRHPAASSTSVDPYPPRTDSSPFAQPKRSQQYPSMFVPRPSTSKPFPDAYLSFSRLPIAFSTDDAPGAQIGATTPTLSFSGSTTKDLNEVARSTQHFNHSTSIPIDVAETLRRLTQRVDANDQRANANDEECESLRRRCDENARSYDALQNDFKDVIASHQILQAKYEKLQNHHESLQYQCDETKTAHEALQTDYIRLGEEYREVMASFKFRDQQCETQREEIFALQSDWNDLDIQVKSLKNENGDVNSRLTLLESENLFLKDDNRRLHSHVNILEGRNANLEKDIQALQDENLSLRNENGDLERKMEVLTCTFREALADKGSRPCCTNTIHQLGTALQERLKLNPRSSISTISTNDSGYHSLPEVTNTSYWRNVPGPAKKHRALTEGNSEIPMGKKPRMRSPSQSPNNQSIPSAQDFDDNLIIQRQEVLTEHVAASLPSSQNVWV
jgi:predicted  nucleic acid-binding Zn-ribbon protein